HALAAYGAAAGPSGYVVVGDDGPSGAIWFSPDLKSWQRGGGEGRDDLTAEKDGNRWIRSAVGGSFGFVAVGGMRKPDSRDPGHPAVWTSPGGKKWRLPDLQLPSGVSHGWLRHVAAKGDVLIAAGDGTGTSGTTALSFISTDGGKTWRESRLPSPDTPGPTRITAVAATPQGFAVSGATGETGTADVVMWTSADGTSWEVETPGGDVLAGTGDQEITGLTPFNDTLLGVGRTVSRYDEQPVLWSRPLQRGGPYRERSVFAAGWGGLVAGAGLAAGFGGCPAGPGHVVARHRDLGADGVLAFAGAVAAGSVGRDDAPVERSADHGGDQPVAAAHHHVAPVLRLGDEALAQHLPLQPQFRAQQVAAPAPLVGAVPHAVVDERLRDVDHPCPVRDHPHEEPVVLHQ